ncbi:Hypothetical Protein FCC1311_043941 [Hondaea fermentalgiana]|uniref:AMP-dependent synthetase/ligase domain-containing protein n=1 Tax=Hondaea fermentalgiana TaxID=2315210 RepID=A0A2R5GDY6_9STRA|nr:Hypothetical Protein FCC1311_043941 [Hondaea fermentalgiana]|eukprot:GBG29150.1 Hypothetical Protein FCC1311_043941 [Hondaea fermentalgiana]
MNVANGTFASWPEELAKSAQLRSEKRAIAELTSDGMGVRRELNFAQLWHASLGVAQWLREREVKNKSRFVILGDDSLEHVVLWAAAALSGAVAVTVDAASPLTSILDVIEDAEYVSTLRTRKHLYNRMLTR